MNRGQSQMEYDGRLEMFMRNRIPVGTCRTSALFGRVFSRQLFAC